MYAEVLVLVDAVFCEKDPLAKQISTILKTTKNVVFLISLPLGKK